MSLSFEKFIVRVYDLTGLSKLKTLKSSTKELEQDIVQRERTVLVNLHNFVVGLKIFFFKTYFDDLTSKLLQYYLFNLNLFTTLFRCLCLF